MSPAVETLVVGAGISGLAYAHARGASADCVVLEAADQAGGLVRTTSAEGWRFEDGPEALPGNARAARALTEALDLGVSSAPRAASKRYLCLAGRLHEIPGSAEDLSTSTIVSFQAKLRLLAEPTRAKGEALDGSIADFARHRLGPEALDRLVDPLVAGIHAGDPEQLSLRACFPEVVRWVEEHGSLLAALKAKPRTPPGAKKEGDALWRPAGGMQRLTDALARVLEGRLRLATRVVALEHASAGFRVRDAGGTTYAARRVVLALPFRAAHALLASVAPEASEALGSMQAESLVSVAHGYRRTDVEHALDGFGFLVPKQEGGIVLGTLFSSTLDPSCAPAGHVLLRSLLGGARAPDAVKLDDEQLLAHVERECRAPLGLQRAPFFTRVTRWDHAIPRYDLEHPRRQEILASSLPPGLALLGNYARGLGIGGLVARAEELARAHVDDVRA